MSFKPYPRYQNSGVTWLGEVPEHWQLRRLGYFFEERREKVSDKDFPALSVTKNGVVPQLETAAKTDDGDNRKRVARGDFVINSRSDRKGSAGLAAEDGSVSLINTVLTPLAGVHGGFIHHLLRSSAFQEEFYRFGKGIVADLWSTNYSEMRSIVLAMPSLLEQEAIAAFLDRETGKVNTLVEEQKKLIALLKEKRQAVISHAVTKGLNPNVPMRDSGIEWLNDIPEHWEVRRLKTETLSIEQGWSPQCEATAVESYDEWGVLKVGCVNRGTFNPHENKALPNGLEPRPELGLKVGDLLISRANTREWVGSAAVVEADYPRLLLCDKLYRLRLNKASCQPSFVALYLGTAGVRQQIELAATGASSSMLNIGQATILELPIVLPPVDEQSAILNWIGEQTARIDELATGAETAIALLQERRSALISAAVTGKIDVRGLVPDQAEAA